MPLSCGWHARHSRPREPGMVCNETKKHEELTSISETQKLEAAVTEYNIIPLREPRNRRVRRALDEWREAGEQWIDKTITLAIELKSARDECGNNAAFS